MGSHKLAKNTILNGMKVNSIANVEMSDQGRYLNRTERSIKNLSPWIQRLKKNEFSSVEINKEASRIKVLRVDKNIT